ncbi:hypothetical protein XI06_27505 [Bradyrhizobium sp. CCBAU 11434]|uniref:hypothetical protein n=1 Tax=Bradyrhizobium TaxID=374 RepID=UPI001EDA0056|nr:MULTISPECIES: hypothetical protein [Bradyrhizobium]MCG2640552.1 hypothetical protein [Bradyrhizobium zhengyangense]MDA9523923.1 hypothetical protein [Bradyrhizobium sp. CCBAU 11434]
MSQPDSMPDPVGKPKASPNPSPKRPSGDSRRGAIAGLIIAAVLLALGLWLARDLTAASKMQDCLMSGRRNCDVIEPAR